MKSTTTLTCILTALLIGTVSLHAGDLEAKKDYILRVFKLAEDGTSTKHTDINVTSDENKKIKQ